MRMAGAPTTAILDPSRMSLHVTTDLTIPFATLFRTSRLLLLSQASSFRTVELTTMLLVPATTIRGVPARTLRLLLLAPSPATTLIAIDLATVGLVYRTRYIGLGSLLALSTVAAVGVLEPRPR